MNTNNASVVSINNGNGLPVFKSESASVLLQELGMPNLVTHCGPTSGRRPEKRRSPTETPSADPWRAGELSDVAYNFLL